jgi:activator of HSP90 ATPase
VKELVRAKIVSQLRTSLAKLGPALIKEHGKDIQHPPGSNPSSGFATPIPQPFKPASIPQKSDTSTTTSSTTAGSLVNTTTVSASDEFRTSAAELFTTFTDTGRLSAFTRSPAKLSSSPPAPKTTFSLLENNVSGTYVKLEEPTLITQKWRLSTWPQGHYADLEMKFDQNDLDHVTVMRCTWQGVPVGQEEVVKKNWEGYFVRGMKQTFGYVDASVQYPSRRTGRIILSFFVIAILTCIIWVDLEPFFERLGLGRWDWWY